VLNLPALISRGVMHDEHDGAGRGVSMTDKLNDIRTTAGRIGVSPWTVRRLIRRGHLRGVHVGRRILVSEKEIIRVIRQGTTHAVRT